MSSWARKFSIQRFTLNVFIMSMCRVFLPEDVEKKLATGEELP
jgi:hypothetical protein